MKCNSSICSFSLFSDEFLPCINKVILFYSILLFYSSILDTETKVAGSIGGGGGEGEGGERGGEGGRGGGEGPNGTLAPVHGAHPVEYM